MNRRYRCLCCCDSGGPVSRSCSFTPMPNHIRTDVSIHYLQSSQRCTGVFVASPSRQFQPSSSFDHAVFRSKERRHSFRVDRGSTKSSSPWNEQPRCRTNPVSGGEMPSSESRFRNKACGLMQLHLTRAARSFFHPHRSIKQESSAGNISHLDLALLLVVFEVINMVEMKSALSVIWPSLDRYIIMWRVKCCFQPLMKILQLLLVRDVIYCSSLFGGGVFLSLIHCAASLKVQRWHEGSGPVSVSGPIFYSNTGVTERKQINSCADGIAVNAQKQG